MKKYAIQCILREDGVTSIEYALIAIIIAIGISVVLPAVGTALSGLYQAVADALP